MAAWRVTSPLVTLWACLHIGQGFAPAPRRGPQARATTRFRYAQGAEPALGSGAMELLKAPPVPYSNPLRDRQILEDLTGMFYQALNERDPRVFAEMWHKDDKSVFMAGDGNVTRG